MAFPIPTHLPRKRDNDVSTNLLSKMSDTPSKSLTYEVASSWVTELDNTIRETKRRIHDRIQADLPAFESQLISAKSVQERLQQLSSNVDELSKSISDAESGLIPRLVMTLTQHATLAQDVSDSDVRFNALLHLSQCKKQLGELTSLTQQGKLPEAVQASEVMDRLLAECPEPLDSAEVMHNLKRTARAAKDRALEQLNEAYSRCIVISAEEFLIRTSVLVRQSDTILTLPSILSSIPPASLSSHMNTLRRDLTMLYIDFICKQPASISVASHSAAVAPSEYKLSIFPAPPTTHNLVSRIENLAAVLDFLRDHLFPHLPYSSSFALSLCKPITTALLNHLLVPSLPSSLDALPSFLQLTHRAVEFERDYICGVLGDTSPEKDVKAWADAVGTHYERRRRVDLLERARAIITREDNISDAFRVEVIVAEEASPKKHLMDATVAPKTVPPVEEEAWDFEEESSTQDFSEENGWDFEDDVEAKQETTGGSSALNDNPPPNEEDPADAWGWNDDDEPTPPDEKDGSTDSSAWDDPWGDEPSVPKPAVVAKPATRLEKVSNKGKSSATSSAVQSPVPTAAPPPTPAMPSLAKQGTRDLGTPQQYAEKESYLVSGRSQELVTLVEDVLREAAELAKSKILPSDSQRSPVGSILGLTSSFILDLYRALYPVTFSNALSTSPKRAMFFSNDCLWLSGEVKRISALGSVPSPTKEKLIQGQERLKVLEESWFEDVVDNQCLKVNEILDGTERFRDTADQDRYDESESAMNEVLQDIRHFAREVKPVLTKTKYFNAIGSIVDAALSRVLSDILALSDIPEVESHKLSELCRILNALESLFVEDSNHPSFVVAYVPSWLKFSYLSELLEASIADISYLFEEGALVDFEIEELVKLVKALFADTPLRANTINKLMQGHPIRS
ncbi:unnamed protein product [Somion occarium]|uniref:ZW10 C-terminal helical domain-containing protein n=2 Tax=Somion occarium TaxID=3059160 RepID=A0ABP1E4S2_9APHY